MHEERVIQEIARARVTRLVENWGWPEPQIPEDIIALGEAAIPAIEAVLTPERLAAAETDGEASLELHREMIGGSHERATEVARS